MGSTSKIVDSYLAVIALLRSEQHVMASVGWVVSTRFDLVFHKPLERWPINWAKFNFGWRAESASTHTAPHALAPPLFRTQTARVLCTGRHTRHGVQQHTHHAPIHTLRAPTASACTHHALSRSRDSCLVPAVAQTSTRTPREGRRPTSFTCSPHASLTPTLTRCVGRATCTPHAASAPLTGSTHG
jgi:hypothetical protein